MRRNLELDGLRGIAATGVVLFHWEPRYTFWMWSFVDLFFVLSGYLISRILIESFQNGRWSLRDFWARRILRIWPVYYLALFTVAAYLIYTQGLGYLFGQRADDFLLSATFLQFTPLYFHSHGDVWAMYDFMPGFLHSWSLAVEEQFYLLWPLLLVFLLRRVSFRTIGWCCVGLAMLGPLSRAYVELPPALLLSRIEGLALGALLAVIIVAKHNRGEVSVSTSRLMLYSGLIAAGLCGITPYLLHGYIYGPSHADIALDPLLVTNFSLVYFGIVGLAVECQGHVGLAILRTKLLTYLGSISYAMYMFHFPILLFIEPRIAGKLGEDLHWLTIGLTAMLLVGLPHLSRILVERPVLSLKSHFTVRYA